MDESECRKYGLKPSPWCLPQERRASIAGLTLPGRPRRVNTITIIRVYYAFVKFLRGRMVYHDTNYTHGVLAFAGGEWPSVCAWH